MSREVLPLFGLRIPPFTEDQLFLNVWAISDETSVARLDEHPTEPFKGKGKVILDLIEPTIFIRGVTHLDVQPLENTGLVISFNKKMPFVVEFAGPYHGRKSLCTLGIAEREGSTELIRHPLIEAETQFIRNGGWTSESLVNMEDRFEYRIGINCRGLIFRECPSFELRREDLVPF